MAMATPSGLNNIPTADVAPEGLLVLQGFASFGREQAPGWFGGLKCGLAQDWELGLDDTLAGSDSAGSPVLQAKYRMTLKPGAALALGLANLSGDRDSNGEPFPYAVVSAGAGPVRGHLGRSWQSGNQAWFVGLDTPLKDGLALRADWIQVADGEQSLTSLGFIGQLSPRWLLEGWVSHPTAAGAADSYVVKLDFVVPLRTER
jgi:hypothetical protein